MIGKIKVLLGTVVLGMHTRGIRVTR
jgi:hypothetical protein